MADTTRIWNYQAVNTANQRVASTMEADSADEVAQSLIAEGWLPASIEPVGGSRYNIDVSAWLSRRRRLSYRRSAEFARQLNQLLAAGVALPKAIRALSAEAPPALKEALQDVAERLSGGEQLSTAMAAHPRMFNEVFVAHVEAGESSGTLPDTVGRLARLLERRAKLSNKIRSVSIYPALVGGVIGLMMVGIMVFLVPQFSEIYGSLGAPLPAATRALVTVSENLAAVAALLAAVAAATTYGLRRYRRTLPNRARIDRIKYRLPLVGKVSRLLALYRWMATLTSMLAAGLPLHRGLDIAARASGSADYQLLNEEVRESVRAGRSLSDELDDRPEVFPVNVRQMVATGEQSGDIGEMLESASEALDDDIDTLMSGMSTKVEVVLLVALGGIVGGMVVVLYLPIISLSSTVLQTL